MLHLKSLDDLEFSHNRLFASMASTFSITPHCHTNIMQSIGLLTSFLLVFLTRVAAYKLSPDDGQADIGAYHVQPGRCAGVEQRLGRTKYDHFFRSSPSHTTFSIAPPSDDGGSSGVPASDLDWAGSGVEQMDATSLCAFNPELTQGYGGGFDKMQLYLEYSRCIYGTNEMRALCGTTDENGKPSHNVNVVQANCPQGTKCKNLCATMKDPSLTSPYAAKQVQLAQCMPMDQWQKLTDMYKPKPVSGPKPDPHWISYASLVKPPSVNDRVVTKKPIRDPRWDPLHVDNDGTNTGKKPAPSPAGNAPPKDPQPVRTPGSSVGRVIADPGPDPKQAPGTEPAPAPKGDVAAQSPVPAGLAQEHPREHQKAPTPMGFRKRALQQGSSRRTHHLHRHNH